MKTLFIVLLISVIAYAIYSCLDEIKEILSKNKTERENESKNSTQEISTDNESVSIEKKPDFEDKPISEMKVKEVVDVVMNSLYEVLSKKVVIFTEESKYKINAVLSALVGIIGLSSIVATNSIMESFIVLGICAGIIYISSERKSIGEEVDEKDGDVIFSVSSSKNKKIEPENVALEDEPATVSKQDEQTKD